jgi:hypothetical protein
MYEEAVKILLLHKNIPLSPSKAAPVSGFVYRISAHMSFIIWQK